ncbi:MAG TPA: hypothetical protein PLL92_00350, partial [Alicycliphilus sp.]|nr:hypothetical protein [Alicycliphilus sp.]
MSTQDPITLACRILRDAAYDLLVNHTPHRARGDWTGEEDAKESYDEHIAAADALERWAASIGAGGVEPLRKGSHQIAASGATFLFEHEDGRYAINPDTTGDPAWHRLGPVDISGIAPVQDAPPAAVAELGYAEVVQAIEERDEAEEFADAVLDSVLGILRPEWSNAYGRSEALEEVNARMDALLAIAPITQAAPQQDNMFEFWWAEHMPEATQAKAWAAWNAAALTGGDEQR